MFCGCLFPLLPTLDEDDVDVEALADEPAALLRRVEAAVVEGDAAAGETAALRLGAMVELAMWLDVSVKLNWRYCCGNVGNVIETGVIICLYGVVAHWTACLALGCQDPGSKIRVSLFVDSSLARLLALCT